MGLLSRFNRPKARRIRAFFHFERAGQRRMLAIAQMPESVLLRGSRPFCVTTVSIVCTIKAPVPVRRSSPARSSRVQCRSVLSSPHPGAQQGYAACMISRFWPFLTGHSRQCFALSPSSIRRRIASGREGWSSWDSAHRSNSRSGAGCNRTVMGVPFPVAGGPRFFRGVTV